MAKKGKYSDSGEKAAKEADNVCAGLRPKGGTNHFPNGNKKADKNESSNTTRSHVKKQ